MRAPNKLLTIALCLACLPHCQHEDIELDERPCGEAQSKTVRHNAGFAGIDLLVAVDNSASMSEEQAILSTQLFRLINDLVFPTADGEYGAVTSLRMAVVTTDMGQQFGDQGYADLQLGSCHQWGDNGRFQTYANRTIDLRPGEIECDLQSDPPRQCPAAWQCLEHTSGDQTVGRCHPPIGDGTDQMCPALNGDYTATSLENPNFAVAFQGACLTNVGIDGCGFEQQLQAAAKGLVLPANNPNLQNPFIRDDHLLVVLVISDEEDCSIADGAMFQVDELIGDHEPNKLNVACGNNNNLLYSPQHYWEQFNALKKNPHSTFFAAIVGVPLNTSAADAKPCEGSGASISKCLEREEMSMVETVETDLNGNDFIVHREACSRVQDEQLVTKARPGRRFVELAQLFNQDGYISSICNEDWSGAMSEIANRVVKRLQDSCFPQQIDWDPSTQKALCDLTVEYVNLDQCPFSLEDGAVPVARTELITGEEAKILECPLPRLAAPLNCAEAKLDPFLNGSEAHGWYYCEDTRESFSQACDPNGPFAGTDEDGDGLTDCQDNDCWRCEVCGNEPGIDPTLAPDCLASCKYKIVLTPKARQTAKDHLIAIACPRATEICQ